MLFIFLRAYASKLVWADRSFSDCLAVLIAYTTWKRLQDTGYFERMVRDDKGRLVKLDIVWTFNRYLQLKVEITLCRLIT